MNTSKVSLKWNDNSTNEQGFKIYRNGSLITKLNSNNTVFNDTGLSPATAYQYAVTSFNSVGESSTSICNMKTLSPSIMVTLDRIGVYDNRENFLRGNGDVYVIAMVSDGNKLVKLTFPRKEGDTYSLDKNETVTINSVIFSTAQVGEQLSIAFVGYESDGGGFEQLVYQALGMAIESSTVGGVGTGLLESYDFSLGELLASFFGAEDDWLGSYQRTWTSRNNWGVGSYNDVVCYDERGQACLRLWFTISSS